MFANVSKLDTAVTSQIRSELIVGDLATTIIELVENSIEAEATCIAVKLNPKTFKIQIVDNGIGIPKEFLEVIGRRYFTSKWNDDVNYENQTTYYGYRGECLASIKNSCARLMIISRPSGENTTYCKVFQGSNPPIVGEALHQRVAKGTTVIVDNFLGNVPVRQNRLAMPVEIQKIKRHIQALALMHPSVSFTIWDDNKCAEILRIERTYSTFKTFICSFPDIIKNRSSMVNVISEEDGIQMKAMICKEQYYGHQLQFVYINKRYIIKSAIRKSFNELLSKSGFLNGARENVTRGAFQQSPLPKPRKNYIFILNICCSSNEYDLTLQSDKRRLEFKNGTKIRTCLIKLVKQFVNQIAATDESTTAAEEVSYLFKKENIKSNAFVPKRIFEKLNYAHTIFGLPVTRRLVKGSEFSINSPFQTETLKKEWPRIEEQRLDGIDIDFFESRCKDDNRFDPNLKGVSLRNDILRIVSEKSDKALKKPDESNQFADGNLTGNEWRTTDVINLCQKQICDTNRDVREHDNYDKTIQDLKCSDFNPNTYLISRVSNKSLLYAETTRLHHEENCRLNSVPEMRNVNEDQIRCFQRKWFRSEFSYSTSTVSCCTTCHRIRCPRSKWVKTNSNIRFYNAKKKYHLNRKNHFELDKTKPVKMCRLNKCLAAVKEYAEKQEVKLSLSRRSLTTEYSLKITTQDRKRTTSNPSVTTWRKNSLTENIKEGCRHPYPKKLLKESILSVDNFHFSPKMPILFSNGNVKSSGFDGYFFRSRHVKSIQVPFTPVGDACQKVWAEKSALTTFNSHKCYAEMKNEKSIFTSNNFIFVPQINQKRSLPYQYSNHCNKSRKDSMCCTRKRNVTRPVNLYRISSSEDGIVDLRKNFDEMNNKMMLLGINNPNQSASRDDQLNFLIRGVNERSTFCRPPCSSTSLIPSPFPDILNTSLSNTIEAEKNVIKEGNPVSVPLLANIEAINCPTSSVRNIADIEFQEDCKKIEWKSCLISCDDGNNFTNEMFFEKMKFKMSSKFLMSIPVTEIPKGMLEVPVAKGNTISLSRDEKNDLRNLVKPCNLKDHITLDDSGNSCLRIFPYLKEHEYKLTETINVHDLEEENCSLVFSKLDLKSIKFLSQIDRKFLLANVTMSGTQDQVLVAFDQHAVDERIRLEMLLKGYINDTNIWKCQSVNPPIFLNMTLSDVSVISDFEDSFRTTGLHLEFNKLNMESRKRCAICVVKVPTCLYNKASKEATMAGFNSCLKQLVESTTKELIECFQTHGLKQKMMPQTVRNTINFEACRGAVKFGDKLSSNVCSALLKNLSYCDVPFQCAHGRPLLTPLVNLARLRHLEKQPSEHTLENLKNLFQR